MFFSAATRAITESVKVHRSDDVAIALGYPAILAILQIFEITIALSFAAAQGRARALRRRLRTSAADEEDFRQAILLDLVARADRFDAARGSWPAFVCVVTRHAAAQIERKQLRVTAFVGLPPQEYDFADVRHRVSAADLAIDFKRAIERLPHHLQRLVAVIAEAGNLARAQRASTLSPPTFYRALRELRLRFMAAGLTDTVFPRLAAASTATAWDDLPSRSVGG